MTRIPLTFLRILRRNILRQNIHCRNKLRGAVFTVGLLAGFGAALMVLPGCGSGTEDAPAEPKTEASAEKPQDGSSEEEAAPERKIPRPPKTDLSPDQVLREMLDVYRQAKLYADEGRIETVWLGTNNKKNKEIVPCSVVFRKPNEIRLDIAGGRLACDGRTMRGELIDSFYEGQRLEKPAPLLFSSIRELYPDIKLADAMDLGTPTNLFWAPPQLILLFAREPLKTFIPNNIRPQMDEPDWFDAGDGSQPAACDRISIPGEDGTRIFWIRRDTRGLARIEFPIEQLAVPDGVRRVLSVTMDFPRQVISPDPSSLTVEPGLFTLEPAADEAVKEDEKGQNAAAPENAEPRKIVEHFLPPELLLYGKPAPNITIQPLVGGYSPVTLNEPDGKMRVLCIWGSGEPNDLPIFERSDAVLKEIQRNVQANSEEGDIEFYAVNVDLKKYSDSSVRAEYGEINVDLPLYRILPSDLAKSCFSKIAVPSLILIDAKGIIQKYCPVPTAFVKLQYMIEQMRRGVDLYQDGFRDYEILSENFRHTLETAESLDLYRTESEEESPEVHVAGIQDPARFAVAAEWTAPILDPANPLAVETADGGLVVVPCEGNTLSVFDASGRLLFSRIPETAAGEPIRFVRTILTAGQMRYFIASSFLDSRKVHLFDDQFTLLGTLDFTQRQQWVADAVLIDSGNDDRPEILLSLVGDSSSNFIPTHGIYSVEMLPDQNSKEFLWSDEQVIFPYCIGAIKNPESGESTLAALNFPVDGMGKLVLDRANSGERLGELEPPADVSILYFTTDETGQSQSIAALIARTGSDRPAFALLDQTGAILSETPLESGTWSGSMDRIIPFDLDGDQKAEWLVPTAEGVVRIFDDTGALIDTFCRGEEISGLAAGHWGGRNHLVFASPEQVTSCVIEPK